MTLRNYIRVLYSTKTRSTGQAKVFCSGALHFFQTCEMHIIHRNESRRFKFSSALVKLRL